MKMKRLDLARKGRKKASIKSDGYRQEKSVDTSKSWEMSASEALKVSYVS